MLNPPSSASSSQVRRDGAARKRAIIKFPGDEGEEELTRHTTSAVEAASQQQLGQPRALPPGEPLVMAHEGRLDISHLTAATTFMAPRPRYVDAIWRPRTRAGSWEADVAATYMTRTIDRTIDVAEWGGGDAARELEAWNRRLMAMQVSGRAQGNGFSGFSASPEERPGPLARRAGLGDSIVPDYNILWREGQQHPKRKERSGPGRRSLMGSQSLGDLVASEGSLERTPPRPPRLADLHGRGMSDRPSSNQLGGELGCAPLVSQLESVERMRATRSVSLPTLAVSKTIERGENAPPPGHRRRAAEALEKSASISALSAAAASRVVAAEYDGRATPLRIMANELASPVRSRPHRDASQRDRPRQSSLPTLKPALKDGRYLPPPRPLMYGIH